MVRAVMDVCDAVRSVMRGSEWLADVRWLLWVAALRGSLPVLKRLLPLPRLVRIVHRTAGVQPRAATVTRRLDLLQQWLQASSPLLSANCLERCLIVYGTTARGQEGAELVVGFRRIGGNVQGHAWVTRGGEPLVEPPAPADTFTRTCAFDARGRMASGHAWSS